ncbi:MAG: Shikimate kinase [Wolbachia endosymbiont of Ctenocephalides orientis wCori]|nr:MAG: Shikimate kinase [Wolbachia endosymbiont of Ctenocephalides orientis wCori]
MGKIFIYLIGFPGSGKSTIAKALCKDMNAVIVSNNLFNNIIFNVIKLPNAEVPDELWKSISVVRENMLAILEEHHIESNYIFTNELIEGDPHDQGVYKLVENMGKKMGVEILSVVLHCNREELIKRVQSEERKNEKKITDSEFLIKRIEGRKIFVPEGALEIDNSNLSPEEVAEQITKKVNIKELVEPFITENPRTNRTHA